MFANGVSGEVTTLMASDMLAAKRFVSPLVDISAGTFPGPATATLPLFSASPYGSVIGHVNMLFNANGSLAATAGVLDIGHRSIVAGVLVADPDSIVDAQPVLDTYLAGQIVTCTLANTLRGTTFMSGGLPVIPTGNQVYATITLDGANTADFVIEVYYVDLEPGQ